MDFAFDERTEELLGQLDTFMHEHVLPSEPVFEEQAAKLASEAGLRQPALLAAKR